MTNLPQDAERCRARVTDRTGFHSYRCEKRAKYGDFCGIHSPERRAARSAARGPSKFERQMEARRLYDEALGAVLDAARTAADARDPGLQRLQAALASFDEVTQEVGPRPAPGGELMPRRGLDVDEVLERLDELGCATDPIWYQGDATDPEDLFGSGRAPVEARIDYYGGRPLRRIRGGTLRGMLRDRERLRYCPACGKSATRAKER